jgi:carboxyl-terminal processing protease
VVKFRFCSLLAAAALALAVLPGCVGVWGRAPATPTDAPVAVDSREARNLQVYDMAWDAVRRHYYTADMHGVDWHAARDRHRARAGSAADDEALYEAINELFGELDDDHTYALSPELAREQREHQGVLVGLISSPFGEQELQRLVLDVLPGSSAAASGVQPGWVLLSVEDRPPSEVLGPGRLQNGQRVRCEFLDNTNTARLLTLTATPVSMDPIRTTHVLEDGVVVLRFDSFDLDTARWVRAQLKAHRTAPAVIVDLRQNPGGLALALARTLGEFFPHSIPMGRFVRRSGKDGQLRASPGLAGARYPGAVAVLVSENSGSCSEIFAHAIREQKRGLVLGTTTAGAVLGAETGSLPGGGELQVSVRDYLTADGKRLEGIGVTPDITVETTVDDLRAGRDPVLEAALARLAASPAR